MRRPFSSASPNINPALPPRSPLNHSLQSPIPTFRDVQDVGKSFREAVGKSLSEGKTLISPSGAPSSCPVPEVELVSPLNQLLRPCCHFPSVIREMRSRYFFFLINFLSPDSSPGALCTSLFPLPPCDHDPAWSWDHPGGAGSAHLGQPHQT